MTTAPDGRRRSALEEQCSSFEEFLGVGESPDDAGRQIDAESLQVLHTLRQELGDRVETVVATLMEAEEVCSRVLATWVDHSEPAMTVYVLTPGVLHRVRGERDPLENQLLGNQSAEEPQPEAKYLPIPITESSNYSLTVTRKRRPGGGLQTDRVWTFEELDGCFSVEDSTPAPHTSRRSAGPFARKLAGEILKRKTEP